MLEFRQPIPLRTPLGEGFAIYVTEAGGLANDTWLVVLDSGQLRHFTTEQLQHVPNGTLGIQPEQKLSLLHFSATRDPLKVACQAISVWPTETTADLERVTCPICKRVSEPNHDKSFLMYPQRG